MIEPFRSILWALGVCTIMLSSVIVIVFLVWVVKLEFSWFFGTDIFKWFKNLGRKTKVWLVRNLIKIRNKTDKANNKKQILLEDLKN